MNNTLTWSAEQLPNLPRGSAAPFETTLDDDRINALTDLVTTLLRELESLRLEQPSRPDSNADLQTRVQEFESNLIRQALRRTSGNQAGAARLLGVKHTTLNAKIHRYKICPGGEPSDCESVVSDQVTVA
jgi:transcriptional regulator with GAF, ATPase, and Fis domain